jgi:hypothetical protein
MDTVPFSLDTAQDLARCLFPDRSVVIKYAKPRHANNMRDRRTGAITITIFDGSDSTYEIYLRESFNCSPKYQWGILLHEFAHVRQELGTKMHGIEFKVALDSICDDLLFIGTEKLRI